MKKGKVLLGMSGGTDSSVSAILLKEQGYEVLGCTFIFYDHGEAQKEEFEEINELAKRLNINHVFVDLTKEFKSVVLDYFVSTFQKGKTPFPCAVCNPEVKWKNLLIQANLHGCDFIATGHYVRNIEHNSFFYIHSGIDPDKDQSFFLWGLNQDVLSRAIFPLGNLTKTEVRKIAKEKGFNRLSIKKDSLGVCFIKGNNYRDFLANELEKKGNKTEPGNFVDTSGEILGRHRGIPFYTVGQRRGLGIHLNRPVFISELRPETNEIVLAEFADLFKNGAIIQNYFFVNPKEIDSEKFFFVKIRYRNQLTPVKIQIINNQRLIINFLEPLESIAPGQTAVFYDGERVVGGGFIESAG